MTARWRTLADTAFSRALGLKIHVVTFEHRDDPGGPWRCVAVQVPECDEPLIAEALQLARSMRARIVIVADTAEQAEAMATRIAITCAQHQRLPYERASAGAFGPLS